MYADESLSSHIFTVPLLKCRLVTEAVADGRLQVRSRVKSVWKIERMCTKFHSTTLQQGCDFNHGLRIVVGSGAIGRLGKKERLFALDDRQVE